MWEHMEKTLGGAGSCGVRYFGSRLFRVITMVKRQTRPGGLDKAEKGGERPKKQSYNVNQHIGKELVCKYTGIGIPNLNHP